jgi:hypothetical protein
MNLTQLIRSMFGSRTAASRTVKPSENPFGTVPRFTANGIKPLGSTQRSGSVSMNGEALGRVFSGSAEEPVKIKAGQRQTGKGSAGSGLRQADRTRTIQQPARPVRRRWWGWWKKDKIVCSPQQLELLLNTVQPVRNTLFDEDVDVVRRSRSRVIYETKPDAAVTQARLEEESDRTWERLRGRRFATLKTHSDA